MSELVCAECGGSAIVGDQESGPSPCPKCQKTVLEMADELAHLRRKSSGLERERGALRAALEELYEQGRESESGNHDDAATSDALNDAAAALWGASGG